MPAVACLVPQRQGGLQGRENDGRASHALRHRPTPEVISCRYREFIADETRRKWEWQCRHEDEAAFWTSVVNGIIGMRPFDFASQPDFLHLGTMSIATYGSVQANSYLLDCHSQADCCHGQAPVTLLARILCLLVSRQALRLAG